MNEGKDNVGIRIISAPEMVIAPEWVRNIMVGIKLNAKETTEIKVCGTIKTPIKGYLVSLIEVIEVAKTSNNNAATWLRDNSLRNTRELVFFEHTCCERILVSE